MPARLVLATRNAHKVGELHAILSAAGVEVSLVGMDAFPDVPDVVEDGLTFEENARKKALETAAAVGLPCVADDSGICVDALHGMPGVFSARWAGRHGDDVANLDLLLAQVSDVADEHRGAHFECAAALALPTGECRVVTGTVEGVLIRARRGTGGFGYDPVFLPHGHDRTTAQMSDEEKNAISHRGRAFRALVPAIDELVVRALSTVDGDN
jgi:XTP/dITP diphosphohydrolase